VRVHLWRAFIPGSSGIFEGSEELLLFPVDADHGQTETLKASSLSLHVAELAIPVQVRSRGQMLEVHPGPDPVRKEESAEGHRAEGVSLGDQSLLLAIARKRGNLVKDRCDERERGRMPVLLW
jgi:hypothetical protein